MRQGLAISALMIVAGCAPTTTGVAPVAAPRAPAAAVAAGLQAVMGQTAARLESQFGKAELDVREGAARKLQFANAVCVLDAYLYPATQGAEPVVTYVDARLPDGRDIDRASCVASLGAK